MLTLQSRKELAALCFKCQAQPALPLQCLRSWASQQSPNNIVDEREVAKFAALSDSWWSSEGPFAPLHKLNPARVKFIRDVVCDVLKINPKQPTPFEGLKVLDVGCGGGLLSESLARLGADTHGIDVTEANIKAAQAHASLDPDIIRRTRYETCTLEDLATRSVSYDVVVASEVIEHVPHPKAFLGTLGNVTKADGCLIVTTMSRTLLSHLLTITMAENVLGMVPKGTHDWSKYLTPEELTMAAVDNNLQLAHLCGLTMDPMSGLWRTSDDVRVNYCAAFVHSGQQEG